MRKSSADLFWWMTGLLFIIIGIFLLIDPNFSRIFDGIDMQLATILGGSVLLVGLLLLVLTNSQGTKQKESISKQMKRIQDQSDCYQMALAQAANGIVLLGKEGNVRFINPVARQMFGILENQPVDLKKDIFSKVNDQDGHLLQEYATPFLSKLAGKTHHSQEIQITRSAGRASSLIMNGAPIFEPDGSVSGTIMVFTEITQRKLDEEEQRKNDQQKVDRMVQEAREAASNLRRRAMETESVFNALSEAVLVYDPDGRVRQANAHAIALFGFDPLHFYRETIAQRLVLKTSEGERVQAQDLPSSHALVGEVLVNQRLTFTNPRGRSYTVLVFASPTILGNDLTGVVEVWHDVTERERLMDQLSIERAREKARAAELEALMDAVPAAVWVAHDPNCKQVTGNRASYDLLHLPYDLDLSQNPLAGGSQGCFRILKDGVELSPMELPMQKVMREKTELHDWEAEIVLKNGTSRYILGNANPLFDEEGQLHGAILAFIDITDLKLAQTRVQAYAAKLERSNYDLEQFAFVASHDLQEPLRKVRFFGERLKESHKDNLTDQENEYIERMLNASQRMQGMISDLLTYSRVMTKARPFEQVDLHQIASEVVTDLEIRIHASGGKVELGTLPVIEADPLQMRQLMQNLIGNALKFHRRDVPPLVRVDSQRVDGNKNGREELLLSIQDNGIGFDPQFLERIFKPFERLHGRSEYEGSGMGLAICHKIVERHHGTITAKGESGSGSTFLIQIPINQTDPETE